MEIRRLLDLRYLGQWRSLSVSVGSPVDLASAVEQFHAEHEREHNYRRDDAPVEVYRLNVRAVGVTPKPELARHPLDGAPPSPAATRPVFFSETREWLDTPVFARDGLPAGASIQGPVVVEQLDSTVLIPPGVRAEIDEWLNIRMHIEEDS
jgi:N-methylhydantoinase A